MTSEKKPPNIAPGEALGLAELVDYGDGAIVSRVLTKNDAGSITLFAFDTGEELSEHTAPFDAFVQVLDGNATITVGGKESTPGPGEAVLMPANIPPAIHAPKRFKMLLTMLRVKDKGK